MQRTFLRLCGPSAHELAGTLDDPARAERREVGLVEAFCFHAFGFLHDDSADSPAQRDALSLLADYGFDSATLGQLPLGMVWTPEVMRERLLADGFTQEEIRNSKLIADQRLAGRLIGPITDSEGRITSFWARHPRGTSPRYLYWRGGWKHRVVAFGLQPALKTVAETGKPIVLVEDVFETLLLWSCGMGRAAAVGHPIGPWDAQRWEQLATAGAGRVVLVPNRSDRRKPATMAAIEASFAAQASPTIAVLPPEKLAPARSPGRLVRSRGIEALRRLLESETVPALAMKAHDLLGKHRPRRGWTDRARRAAMQAAVAFYGHFSTWRGETAELDADFVPPIVAELGWPWGSLGPKTLRRGPGYCTLHDCAETDCFCFD